MASEVQQANAPEAYTQPTFVAALLSKSFWCESLQNTEVTFARMAAAKALELSIDPSRARCVELECLLQAKTAHISHLEVRPLTQLSQPHQICA